MTRTLLILATLLIARVGAAAPTTVDFNAAPVGPLAEHPPGVIAWSAGSWEVAAPWEGLTTRNLSLTETATSGQLTFLCPCTLVSLVAYNGGSGPSMVTLACAGQAMAMQEVAPTALVTIATGWSSPCAVVTVASSNGWFTNFDDLVYNEAAAPPPQGSTVVTNWAGAVEFGASPDHVSVTFYEAGWFMLGAPVETQKENMGKPVPNASNVIAATLKSRPAFGVYRFRARAVVTTGTGCTVAAPCTSAWTPDGVASSGLPADLLYELRMPGTVTIR